MLLPVLPGFLLALAALATLGSSIPTDTTMQQALGKLNRCKAIAQRARVLAVDFDKTLTVADTTADVVAVAKRKHPNYRDFQWFTDEYMKDYDVYDAKWQPIVDARARQHTVDKELLDEYLEALRPVEEASLRRVSDQGILAGVSRAEFAAGGRAVAFQQGAAAAISQFLSNSSASGSSSSPRYVHIISVNWSADFIRGALEAHGVPVDDSRIAIHSNSPEFSTASELSTGVLRPRMVVASDKVSKISEIKTEIAKELGAEPFVAYAGDSLTDLPALLAADVGLFVGQSSSVAKWCEWLGIKFGQARDGHGAKTLHRLAGWNEANKLITQ
ncbi:hypothetical protein GQ54DRAFT_296482 [Martensiomyces pterosporus]|nr:hypothetical protein GQ54DRAFT_296482 [Martensiomyces pterosporus]